MPIVNKGHIISGPERVDWLGRCQICAQSGTVELATITIQSLTQRGGTLNVCDRDKRNQQSIARNFRRNAKPISALPGLVR